MRLGVLLVRADASTEIGAGHFMRCLALAQAWRERGGSAIFLMAPGAAGLAQRLQEENIGEVRLAARPGSTADAEETAALAIEHSAAWVVLDGYHFSPGYQRALKESVSHLLLLDDLGKDDLTDAERYHADLLLNQNAYATPAMYAGRAGNVRLLLGAAYFLLRREFHKWRDGERHSEERKAAEQARNLLVTLGGSDAENATAGVLKALAALSAPLLNVKVLVGAGNPHRVELQKLAANLRHSVEFQIDTKRMADEMAWADYAISAAGSTSWELAFMGLPSLLITLSENQRGCAEYLSHHGIALSLGWHDQLQPAETAAALSALAADAPRRQEMSARGRDLIDGKGADRVVEAMASLASGETEENTPGNAADVI